MLAAVAVTQAVLLGLVLPSTGRGNLTVNRLLAALVLTIGTMISLRTLVQSPFVVVVPHLIRVNGPLDFLPGPLLFLYVRAAWCCGSECRRIQILLKREGHVISTDETEGRLP